MSAVCPKCGVAVVPGYIKCPKCHTPLPSRTQANGAAGGTAVSGATGGLPIVPILAGLAVAIGIVVFFATRKSGSSEAAPPPATTEQPATEQPPPAAAAPIDPTAMPNDPPPVAAAHPDPAPALGALDKALQQKRLWGTVTTIGTRVDVRSGSCSDPGMGPVIDAAIPPLRDAGLTKLRCLEQSGAVVFERDL